MKAKKILALILAVLLGIGVISPLFYIMAEATEAHQNEIEVEAIFKKAYHGKTSTTSLSKIRKGNEVRLFMDVVYYGYKAPISSDGSYEKPEILSYNGKGSFALKNYDDLKPDVIKIEVNNEKNYTKYEVMLPVRYSGTGNSLAFDLRVNETTVLKCSGIVPHVEEYREEPDDEDEKDPDPVTPYIIIENYTYGGDSVIAGNDFVLDLTLRNTSEDYSLQNIVMNVATQGVLSMGSSSNTFYIDDLHAGSTMKKQIVINAGLNKVTDDKDANSISIKFDFQYLNGHERRSGSSSENITIPVTFPDRFELSPPEMGGSSVFTGEEWYIYIPMVNKGRSSVNNITAYVECEGLDKDYRQYVGNLQAGSESGIDFSFPFSEPGLKEGRIVITYEDTNMNPKELSVPFSVEVQEMIFPEHEEFPMDGGMMPPMPEEVPEEKGPSKLPIVVTAIVVCAISAYITVLKAKAKRSIFEDEEI